MSYRTRTWYKPVLTTVTVNVTCLMLNIFCVVKLAEKDDQFWKLLYGFINLIWNFTIDYIYISQLTARVGAKLQENMPFLTE